MFFKPATGGNVLFDFLKLNRNTKKSFFSIAFLFCPCIFWKWKLSPIFWIELDRQKYVAFQKLQKMLNHTTLLSHTVYVHTYLGTGAPVKKKLCSSWGEHFSIRFKTRRDLAIFYMFSHFFSPVGEWGSKHLKTTLRIKCTQKSA